MDDADDAATLLTIEQLAKRWVRREGWVRQQAKQGDIPGIKIGGRWRFDLEDIRRYETRHKNRDPLSLTPLAARRLAGRNAR